MSDDLRFRQVDSVFRQLVREGPVLELGCGDGRVLSMLERAGHVTVGVDFDRGALQEASARGLRALVHADAHDLPFAKERFGAVVSGFFGANMMDRDRMIAEASRVLRPGGILAYSLLNPFWRVADLAQYRLRRGLPLQLPELVKRGRHLGDPSGDFERLRRRGLVPFSLQGSMVLPGLRRSETFLKRAPLLRGGWTRFAWDVVVSGARPIGRSDVALDRDSQRYMDALDGGKKCVFSTESEACSVVPLSTCRLPRSGQEYLFIQPDGLRVGRLKAQERTASGDAFCFDSAWLPVWRNGILGEVLLGTRRDVRR